MILCLKIIRKIYVFSTSEFSFHFLNWFQCKIFKTKKRSKFMTIFHRINILIMIFEPSLKFLNIIFFLWEFYKIFCIYIMLHHYIVKNQGLKRVYLLIHKSLKGFNNILFKPLFITMYYHWYEIISFNQITF